MNKKIWILMILGIFIFNFIPIITAYDLGQPIDNGNIYIDSNARLIIG